MHARQAVSRSFLVVFIFLFMLALAGPAQAAPLAEPGSAAGVPILLQYTASGHVLGFAADKVYLAGLEHALTMAFVNGQSKTPTGEAAASSAGANGTPALGRVTYQDMWPGVDVVYTAAQGGLAESSYIIKAGANPEDIQLAYNTPAQLMADNRLCFAFESGYMTESAPVAFQEINGQRIPVAVRFRLNDGLVGFTLGHYNPEHALTIDPLYTWHAFYGSATWDEGYAVTSDASGNLYVAGYSDASWNGPGAKAPLNTHAGNHDIVVVKLNGTGAYQWHTFHGSNATDYGNAITNDANGNLYVAGYSYATWNGPGSAAPLNAHAGNNDITVLKLNSAGAYQWHTFHGSTESDYGYAVTQKGNGNLYVAGSSYATWNGPGAAAPLNTYSGTRDIVTLKLNISSPGIIVTSNADTQAADGLCTLREAILNSNHNDQSGSSDCPSGGGGTATITFSIPHPNTITLNSQLPAITDDLTIQGLGANQLTISGNDNDRVLSLNPGVFLTLNDLTIAHGQAPSGHGGGVEVAGGNLTVTDCVFSSNQAPGSGGAIHNGGGSLTIQDTTFSNNQADYGGAIASGEGVLSVTRSTFNGNSATTGGGAINNYLSTTHPVTVTSSTFYDNSATAHGGAVYNDNSGTLTIANSTFSVNSAPEGGSLSNAWGATLNVTNCTFSASGTSTSGTLRNFDGTVTLRNSILAYDGGDNCHNSDTLTANTYNLASDTSCGSAKLTTLANLKLGPLQNNGGSTQTMALLAGSSAIGAGNNNTCAFPVGAPSYGAGGYDQSGTHRPQGISCDSGAFEFQSTTSTFNSAGSQDGWVLESGENSAKGGSLDAAATTLRLGDDNARNQYRSILSFETSSLPDNAVIMKVVLKVKKQGVTGGGDPLAVFQGFKAGVKKGFFGTAAALAASDFQALASKTVGPFTPTPASGWYSLDLTGAKAYINKLNANGGLTQVRLFFTLGDNDNSLANYLSLYSGNAGAASRPKLIIEYYLP